MLVTLDTAQTPPPTAVLLEEPASFSRFELEELIRQGLSHEASSSQEFRRILLRIVSLRGNHVTWAFGLALAHLGGRKAKRFAYPPSLAIAPLTIFKIKGGQWIPKVVIYLVDEFKIGRESLIAGHVACRGSGIECMCLTEEDLANQYVEGREFKRAFNGAFFCDPRESAAIFCPSLRRLGMDTWPKAPPAPAFYQ